MRFGKASLLVKIVLRFLVLLLICSCMSCACFKARGSKTPIEYTINGENNPGEMVASYNKQFTLKLKNANPFVYNYEITSEGLNYSTALDPAGSFLKGKSASLDFNINGFADELKALKQDKVNERDVVGVIEQVDILRSRYEKINDIINAINMCREQLISGEDPKKILAIIRTTMDSLANENVSTIGTLRSDISNQVIELQSINNDHSNKIIENLEKMKKELDSIDVIKTELAFNRYKKISENDFTYSSNLIKADCDVVAIKVQPVVREEFKDRVKQTPIPIEFQIETRGGSQQFVTAGFFFVGDLYDKSYRLDKTENDTLMVIRRNRDNKKQKLTYGAMFHYTCRTDWYWKFNLNFGFGFEEGQIDKSRVFAGVGFIWGPKDILALSGGVAIGQTDVLKQRYSEGELIEKGSLAEGDLTEKETSVGWFVSVSTNFIKLIAGE